LRIRVLTADARTGTLRVYDAADRELVGSVDLGSPAVRLLASHTGDTVAALTAAGAAVTVVGGGVAVIPHKDHVHIFKSPVAALGVPLARGGAATVAAGAGSWASSFAEGTAAYVVTEKSLLQGSAEPRAFGATAPHAGAALPLSGSFAMSRASVAGTSDEIVVVGEDGPVRARMECRNVTAAVLARGVASFACSEGLVTLDDAGTPRGTIAAGGVAIAELAATAASSTVAARTVRGDVLALDVAARASEPLALGSMACDVVMELAEESRIVVLTADGHVHRFDGTTRVRLSTTPAVAPFECASPERPHLAATPGRAWVTVPARGELLEVDTLASSIVRRIAVGGAPAAVAIAGLDARNANLAPGNDRLSD